MKLNIRSQIGLDIAQSYVTLYPYGVSGGVKTLPLSKFNINRSINKSIRRKSCN